MSTDPRFEMILPPTTETYSNRNSRPCRFEYRSDGPGGKRDCPFKQVCIRAATTRPVGVDFRVPMLKCLEEPYGIWLRTTQVEPSTSIVNRSEHQFSQDERHRFALRRHLYELAPKGNEVPFTGTNWGDASAGCHDLCEDDQYRMYLGFVDTRPQSQFAPISLGVLAPPKRFRQDPQSFVMTGLYGRLFGGEGFPSTIYSMHEPDITGAYCAQACVIMSLGMLADRGAILRGSFTITAQALLKKHTVADPQNILCLGDKYASSIMSTFDVDGLTATQMANYLKKHGKVGAFKHRIGLPRHYDVAREVRYDLPTTASRFSDTRLFLRVIEAYVYARFPVMLMVDSDKWLDPDRQERTRSSDKAGHTVVVVGVRKPAYADDADTVLITHDPSSHPYLEKDADASLTACQYFGLDDDHWNEGRLGWPQIVATTDTGVVRDPWSCLSFLLQYPQQFPRLHRCLMEGTRWDVRVRLAWRDDVADVLLSQATDIADSRKLSSFLCNHLPAGRYWVVGCYNAGSLVETWLFDVECPSLSPRFFELDYQGFQLKQKNCLRAFNGAHNGRTAPTGRPREPEPEEFKVALGTKSLGASVITSSSIRDLDDLLTNVRRVDAVQQVDLLMLRDTDVLDMLEDRPGRRAIRLLEWQDDGSTITVSPDGFSVPRILACDQNVKAITSWIGDIVKRTNVKIAAFASYLPGLVRLHAGNTKHPQRILAERALANLIKIAVRMREEGHLPEDIPTVIEIVCGSRLDDCTCRRCKQAKRIFEASPEVKIRGLLQSLSTAFTECRQSADVCIALELEPGPTYLLNDVASMTMVSDMIDAEFLHLRPHVGFNLDLAHMRIAEISAEMLMDKRISHRIVHAHIADHPPFMHTRDQVPGTWTPMLYGIRRGYLPYLRLMAKSAAEKRDGLPGCTRMVALELEGCNRIAWVHQGLAEMKQLLDAV